MTQYSVGGREQLVSEVGALQAGGQHHLGLVVLVETLRDVKCLVELLVYELPKKDIKCIHLYGQLRGKGDQSC